MIIVQKIFSQRFKLSIDVTMIRIKVSTKRAGKKRLKRFETISSKLWPAACAATRWQISTRRGRLPSRLPFANFTTVIWRSLGYLLLGMATPWPRGKLTNFTERDSQETREGKIRFYEREELPWTFIGFVKAVGIRLPWICTCSRVKGKKKKKIRKKRRRVIL